MTLKRRTAAVSALFAALVLAAGCGGGDSSSEPPSSSGHSPEPATGASKQPAQSASVPEGKGKPKPKQAGGSAKQKEPDRSDSGGKPRSPGRIPEGEVSDPAEIRRVVKEVIARGADKSRGGSAPTPAQIVREVLEGEAGQDQQVDGGKSGKAVVEGILEGK